MYIHFFDGLFSCPGQNKNIEDQMKYENKFTKHLFLQHDRFTHLLLTLNLLILNTSILTIFFLNILVNEKYLKILWTMKWLKERRKLRNIHKHVCIYTHIYIHYTRNHIQLNKQKHTVRIHSNTETLAYTHTSISTPINTHFITLWFLGLKLPMLWQKGPVNFIQYTMIIR